MVVVDSSALIPLARIGRLDLVRAAFSEVHTVVGVQHQVVVEGKPGTAALRDFLDDVTVHDTPDSAANVASLEGLAQTDAAVVLLADQRDDILLANDQGLLRVARSHGVEDWWVTTLLLKCAKIGYLSGEEATDVLYDLVDAGMNLDPQVYARLQRKLDEIGD
ncbi:hypothetical protein ACKVMT_12470 [Halobacteriales archaeon Cl-PHB]